jgi:ribosome recycling factor
MRKIVSACEDKMKKSVQACREELGTIRTGRASAGMFEKVKVDYYGNPTPLNQLATVSVPESRLVIIQPWDKSAIGDIEKAILRSELSLTPNNDGKVIRINIPPLTDERRKEYVKLAKSVAENGRVAIRNIRREANDELKKAEKDGEISEDEQKRAEDDVQKLTDSYIDEINTAVEDKEKEIFET